MGSYLVGTIDQVHTELEKLLGDSEQRKSCRRVLSFHLLSHVEGRNLQRLALHCSMPPKLNNVLMDLPGHQGSHIQRAYTPSMVIMTQSRWFYPNTTAPTKPQQPTSASDSAPAWSCVLWSRDPHSLEDEGHCFLPVLPLKWQGPCEHLELQSKTEQVSLFLRL